MTIWQREINLGLLNDRGKQTLADFLDIEFIEVTDTTLVASMPVLARHKQPLGIMHGGVSCVLAETVGSTAANFCVDQNLYCVGLDINTNHISSVREGKLIATASAFHLGKSTQVWGIDILTLEGKRISINRLTMAVLQRQR